MFGESISDSDDAEEIDNFEDESTVLASPPPQRSLKTQTLNGPGAFNLVSQIAWEKDIAWDGHDDHDVQHENQESGRNVPIVEEFEEIEEEEEEEEEEERKSTSSTAQTADMNSVGGLSLPGGLGFQPQTFSLARSASIESTASSLDDSAQVDRKQKRLPVDLAAWEGLQKRIDASKAKEPKRDAWGWGDATSLSSAKKEQQDKNCSPQAAARQVELDVARAAAEVMGNGSNRPGGAVGLDFQQPMIEQIGLNASLRNSDTWLDDVIWDEKDEERHRRALKLLQKQRQGAAIQAHKTELRMSGVFEDSVMNDTNAKSLRSVMEPELILDTNDKHLLFLSCS